MDPSEEALIDLISRARQGGSLTMEDLRQALPVDSMTVEDISQVLARLDQAGFDVEIDPALLSPEDKTAPKDAAPTARREQRGLQETIPEGSRQRTSFPTSVGDPTPKTHTVRRSGSTASAPMLPWIVAFAVVVIAVFAAFGF